MLTIILGNLVAIGVVGALYLGWQELDTRADVKRMKREAEEDAKDELSAV